MATTAACSICGQEDSWRHSLFECNLARCIWALTDEDIIEHVAPACEPHARKWLFSMIETMNKTDLIRMLVTMWAIWHAKRKAVHEEVYQSPIATVTFVSRFLEDLGEVKNTGDRVQPKEPKQAYPDRKIVQRRHRKTVWQHKTVRRHKTVWRGHRKAVWCRETFEGKHRKIVLLVSFPTQQIVRTNCPELSGVDCLVVHRITAPLSSLHVAPTVPARTYEELSRLVSPSAASQCLVAGYHRLVVPPARQPRRPARKSRRQ
ncbi:hypothetical protein QYE76_068912 [Lolium multiflorum]|uniref:Reverse transcriptase zinc-binding domain-containing protein n=1 Tax=Lolium multiflorum TaxID=4521 RepID=A0AAD8WEE7_LOLMU|nr:hypothetical protein QYE76_068912 [Lolium multiflorum]